EGTLDLAIERMRFAGRQQAGAAFLEKGEAQRALQVADEAAHRWLRHADELGGRRHSPGQHDGPESFELTRVEHGVLRGFQRDVEHNISAWECRGNAFDAHYGRCDHPTKILLPNRKGGCHWGEERWGSQGLRRGSPWPAPRSCSPPCSAAPPTLSRRR